MKLFSTAFCLAATLTGVVAMTVDTWSNLEFQAGQALTIANLFEPELWNSLMAAIVIVAIATAVALTAAGLAWQRSSYGLALGLLVAFICGAGYSLNATITRVAETKDAKVYEKRADNEAITRLDAAIERATAEIVAAKAGMKQECDGRDPARLSDKGWPACRGHWKAAETASQALALAQGQRGSLGTIKTEDSGAERVAALFPFVSAKQVTLYQPVLLPVALFLFGNLLTAFGLAGLAPAHVARPAVDAMHVEAETPMRDITPADPVVAVLKQQGRAVNNAELARMIGQSDATASRTARELARNGKVKRWREGRHMMTMAL